MASWSPRQASLTHAATEARRAWLQVAEGKLAETGPLGPDRAIDAVTAEWRVAKRSGASIAALDGIWRSTDEDQVVIQPHHHHGDDRGDFGEAARSSVARAGTEIVAVHSTPLRIRAGLDRDARFYDEQVAA